MKTIGVREAFGIAFPRRAAVLCVQGPGGATDMILADWFNWLNLKRQPMISFAMDRRAALGTGMNTGDALVLAFPPVKAALQYQKGFRTAAAGEEKVPPEGVEPCALRGVPVLVPAGSEIVLRCTVSGAYNYPFKKIRIFNCSLEEAIALKQGDTVRQLPRTNGEPIQEG